MIAALLLSVDFNNFKYTHDPCSSNVPVPVVMQNGGFSYTDPHDQSVGFDLHVDRVVEGSLSPRTRHAIVIIECQLPAGEGGMAAAYLYAEHGNTAVYVDTVGEAEWGPDWGEGQETIHVRFTDKFLYVDRCNEVFHCLDDNVYVVTTYALRNGKIVKVYEETHKRAAP